MYQTYQKLEHGKWKKRGDLSSSTILKYIITAVVICVSLFFLQKLVQPKYMSDVVEGRLIAEYYDEEKDHDVIFVGDCEVYENFSPKVLWEEYGIFLAYPFLPVPPQPG